MRLQPGIIIVPSKSAPVLYAVAAVSCFVVVVVAVVASPARLRFRCRSHFSFNLSRFLRTMARR